MTDTHTKLSRLRLTDDDAGRFVKETQSGDLGTTNDEPRSIQIIEHLMCTVTTFLN